MRLPLPTLFCFLAWQRNRYVIFFKAVCPPNLSIVHAVARQPETSSNSANHTWRFFSSIYIQRYFTKGEESNGSKNQTSSSFKKLIKAHSIWVNQLYRMAFGLVGSFAQSLASGRGFLFVFVGIFFLRKGGSRFALEVSLVTEAGK